MVFGINMLTPPCTKCNIILKAIPSSLVESGTNKIENVRCLQLYFIFSCLVLHIDYLSCKSFDYKLLSHTNTILFHSHLDAVFGNCWDPTPHSQYLFGALCNFPVFVSD